MLGLSLQLKGHGRRSRVRVSFRRSVRSRSIKKTSSDLSDNKSKLLSLFINSLTRSRYLLLIKIQMNRHEESNLQGWKSLLLPFFRDCQVKSVVAFYCLDWAGLVGFYWGWKD